MQDLVRISQAIADGSFFRNEAFVNACRSVRRSGGTLHLLGLLGKGGVHAVDRHLFALIDLAERERVERVTVHALTDGRDTMPTSGLGYMHELVYYARGRARVACVGGRYFGMDRDKRWDRTEKWYRASVDGVGPQNTDPLAVITAGTSAVDGRVHHADGHCRRLRRADRANADGDVVICYNYRSDGCDRLCGR